MSEEYKLPEAPALSEFRVWLIEKWYQHKDEILVWEKRLPEYDDKYYFRKHKWMLRKMYKEERGNV
jgi:hypothetical protein